MDAIEQADFKQKLAAFQANEATLGYREWLAQWRELEPNAEKELASDQYFTYDNKNEQIWEMVYADYTSAYGKLDIADFAGGGWNSRDWCSDFFDIKDGDSKTRTFTRVGHIIVIHERPISLPLMKEMLEVLGYRS